MAMAQPSTETPAWRLFKGWPKPPPARLREALPFGSCKAATDSIRQAAGAAAAAAVDLPRIGAKRAARTAWSNAIAGARKAHTIAGRQTKW
eukprot:CAMPEP_0183542374 /NCGR_PEP_ID=MMETSP0371-20130417/42350_1 /TAXON_ID=268820 /ORGANISM="Peridinium aciculiferum, Strain PAER-2" /LENGTH=90 /DNA_ID=CAMNT_0025743615 /DNA_START=4 /DNA_END=273 /DNA_ORIENTATION=+